MSVSSSDRLRPLAYALFVLLFVWPLFAGGLYHETPRFIALWEAAAAFFVVSLLAVREGRFLRATPARLAALALWLAYVLAAITVAVAPRAALVDVVKHGLYLGVFLVASEITLTGRRAVPGETAKASRAGVKDTGIPGLRLAGGEGLAQAAWAAASLLALLSLAAGVGLLPFQAVQGDRLYTFLSYPNSAGSLFGAAFIVGLGLSRGWLARSRVGVTVRAAGQWLCLVSLLLTMSRGAWLVFPVALGLALFIWPAGRRLAPIGEVAFTGVAALAVGPFLAAHFGQPAVGGGLLLLGLAAAVASGWLGRWFGSLPARRQMTITVAAFLAVALAAGGLLLFAGVPHVLRDRLTGFSLSERSVWERLAWSRDAVAIVKDYPILGLGGGGWASRYFQYQSYGYFTTEVHNDFAQVWVETGTVGLLAFLALLGASVLTMRRLLRARREAGDTAGRVFLAAVGGGAGMLVLHSALDFDLTLAAVGIFLWAFLGIIDGLHLAEGPPSAPPTVAASRRLSRAERRHGDGLATPSTLRSWALPLAGVTILAVLAGCFAAADHLTAKGARLGSEGRYEESLAALRKARTVDPFSSPIRTGLAVTMEALAGETGDRNLLAGALGEMQAAARLDAYNPDVHNTFGLFALRNGLADLGVAEFEKAVELQPFDAARYGQVAQACLLLGQSYLQQGERDPAVPFLEHAAGIPARLAEQATKVPDYVPVDMALPAVSPIVSIWSGKAEALLGHWDRSVELLQVAHDADLCAQARETRDLVAIRRAEAVLWLSVIEEFQGNDEAAATYRAELGATAADPVLEQLRRLLSQASES